MPDTLYAPTLWTQVANAFKGSNAVLFDLFNEPYPDAANRRRVQGALAHLTPLGRHTYPPPRAPCDLHRSDDGRGRRGQPGEVPELNARDRAQLVVIAYQSGLVRPVPPPR